VVPPLKVGFIDANEADGYKGEPHHGAAPLGEGGQEVVEALLQASIHTQIHGQAYTHIHVHAYTQIHVHADADADTWCV
jgi:hypothetical protein